MSDSISRGGIDPADKEETEARNRRNLPPEELPEELLIRRLGRLDTRRALANLCKSVPGLDEILLPRGIQADALTRKAGGSTQMLRSIARRVMHDEAAWDAFRTAISEQIPPETSDAVENLDRERLAELRQAHTTEGLLLAALSAENEPDPELVQELIDAWKEENEKAEEEASKDARVKELEQRLGELRKENERLQFISRTAREQASALGQEVEVLRSERENAAAQIRRAEERAAAALEAHSQMKERLSELHRRNAHLERSLESERSAYATAARRVEELYEELGKTREERDRIRDALENARFTDPGFGALLVRAVKNEVGAMPESLESAGRTARLLEFMGKVLQVHSELREASGRNGSAGQDPEEENEADPSQEPRERNAGNRVVVGNGRPTLSFRALGGAGEVGGSSHLLDFGRSRVLIDAGIKPDGHGPMAPDFSDLDNLSAAVITHAHLDHCGALPLLVRDRPDLPIYCTPPSARLILSALNDHAAMGGGLPGGAPLHEVKKRLRPMPFGKPFDVGGARVTLTESGHILGAASVLLESGSATVFHTGDICMEDHFSIPSARLPQVHDIDLLVMEATLADQKPQPFSESIKKMVHVINETTQERGGLVLIPTYALGQAQEIILGLKRYGEEYGLERDVFIYVDGSVVTISERLYAEQLGYMKPYLQQTDPKELFFSDNIRAVDNDDRARERILSNPCAIIASPVTMQGGASAFYRRRLQKDPKNAVILPSNAASSYGAHRAAGEQENWRVERVSFAAHCTQDELLSITERLNPRQIILIHGSRRRISDLAYRLAPNHKIHTPAVGETVRTVL
ncbi:MBL fold metallo-hydrolase [Rubrobacter calidifluminis]|uniref:MBL fold metallo-hydrolase n=1 Tax=Rubrobacter calidifluminis TaxID=1392640 RepID=UPI0023602C6F|nr:MBL fold metallo-hydrolase [Rubrobacter calidifluminis]